MTKTVCEICKREISSNNIKKHLKSHETHPENHLNNAQHVCHDGLTCIYCNKLCKNKNSLAQHECRCKNNPNRYQVHSNFIGYKAVGRTAWNKGLTKYTDERVKRNGEAIHRGYENGSIKKLIGENNSSKRIDVRQKISSTCLKKASVGEWHTSLAKDLHFNYNGIDLHGSWELAYAKYLDANNIQWVRCKDHFKYIFEEKVHYYTPDFYLIESDEYVEIKGFKTKKDIAKWSQFPSSKTLKVLLEKDLKDLGVLD